MSSVCLLSFLVVGSLALFSCGTSDNLQPVTASELPGPTKEPSSEPAPEKLPSATEPAKTPETRREESVWHGLEKNRLCSITVVTVTTVTAGVESSHLEARTSFAHDGASVGSQRLAFPADGDGSFLEWKSADGAEHLRLWLWDSKQPELGYQEFTVRYRHGSHFHKHRCDRLRRTS